MIESRLAVTKQTPLARRGLVVAEHPLGARVGGGILEAGGLALALERYGTMAWADALEPAITLAREGFVPDWYQALTTARYIEELGAFPETARTYLRNGRAIHRPPSLEPGERVRYPDLAE